ncbi:MAG TPA: CbiX/SirB N-terminal domain-containing protein [Microbacteriaceae bacterium]|nr:CbiX/SirB N-terminal domain-containing protein [Microbacteriaceae bacterium]
MTSTLIACAHGTGSAAGRAAIRGLLDQVRTMLPDIRVEEAFVDVQEPRVADVVDRCVPLGDVVVVPILLSTGYHTEVDIARAVAAHPGRAAAAPPLGPHEALAAVLEARLAAAGARPGDAVVLAAAGSSDPRAAGDVEAMAELLTRRIGARVRIGFAAGDGPRIDAVVAAARRDGADRVAVASYVLAPGYFANVIAAAGGDIVTAPLAPDEAIARLVVERFEAAEGRVGGRD